jgi:arginine/ornithine N-succinyltransferase beta subunit
MAALELVYYSDRAGREPLNDWLGSRIVQVHGAFARDRIHQARRRAGTIDYGPGYPVYVSRQGPVVVVLLCGSSKR